MKQTIGLVLGWMALASVAALEQRVEAQTPAFLANYYSAGPASVTISTRAGQVLSVLEVPANVEVSLHLIEGDFTTPSDSKGAVTFNGNVSIRTTLRSEAVSGPLREQMMKAPVKLDVQDAVVVVKRPGTP